MSLFGTGRREAVLAVLLLVGLALIQNAPGLFAGQHRRVLRPSELENGTAAVWPDAEIATNEVQLIPSMREAGRVAATGTLPTWNPNARLGEPFAATGAPILYPPFWLFAWLSSGWVVDLLCWFHAALACVFGYRFLRALPVSRYAACIAAGGYGLGWFSAVAANRLPEAAAAAILPWVLECTWRCLFATRRSAPAFGLALGTTLMFATGGTSTAWLGVALAAALWTTALGSIDRADRGRAALAWVGGITLAVCVTAPAWLAWIESAPAFAAPTATAGPALSVGGLFGILVPGLFGELGAATPLSIRDWRGSADPIQHALYPGALALAIVLMAILRPKRNLLSLFWVAAAGIALLISLDGAPARFLTGWMPATALRPGAGLGVFHLAMTVLVAFGVEGFLDAPHQRRFALPVASWVTLAACVAGAVVLLLPPAITSGWLVPLWPESSSAERATLVLHVARLAWLPLVATSAIAISLLAWRRLGVLRLKTAIGSIALAECLLLSLVHVPRGPDRPAPGATVAGLTGGEHRVITYGADFRIPASWLAATGPLRAVDTDGTAILDRTATFLSMIDGGMVRVGSRAHVRPLCRATAIDDPLLLRAGVDTVVADGLPPNFTYGAAPGGAAVSNGPAPHTALLPVERCRLVFDVIPVRSPDAAANALAARPDLDRTVVEIGEHRPLVMRAPKRPTHATIVSETADRVVVDVDTADGQGLVVLGDAIAPGWTATLDDEPAPILAADLAFRAVAVPPGIHRVAFHYRPWSVRYGLPLMAFGAVLSLALLVGWWIARRRELAFRPVPIRGAAERRKKPR